MSGANQSGQLLIAGQAAALAAAMLWAIALMLFRGPISTHGARTINLAKCLMAALLQGATVAALGQAGSLGRASPTALALVAASGILGLTLGDTALFAAIARIGVHRTLLLQTLTPVFAALIALFWLQETPSARQALGAAVILAGVALVVAPSREGARPSDSMRAIAAIGITLGVVSAGLQGLGIVLAKVGMEQIPALPASALRLAAATAGLLVLALLQRNLGGLRRLAGDRVAYRRVIPATLIGTYLAMFLYMIGVALAPAAIAATLISTSPVFSLFLESVIERRLPTIRGVLGTAAAVGGVAILTTA